MIKKVLITLTLFLLVGCARPAITEGNTLEKFSVVEEMPAETDLAVEMQFAAIAKEAKGKLGVGAVEIETGRTAYFNQSDRFAIQSVVKLPISMAVLRHYGDAKMDLNDVISIGKDEYVPANMHSPLRDAKVSQMTVRELIRSAVSESDGTAADVLQRVAGGAEGVQAFIDSLGIDAMKVKYSHKEFAQQWERQYENWSTPEAAVALLNTLWRSRLERGDGAAKAVQGNTAAEADLLLEFMTDSNNPDNRIKGLLPKDAIVAHKTGTGGTKDGVTSATNDVGIITLPNGKHVALAVFVRDSSADDKTRAAVIAKVARAVWDRWGIESTSKE